MTEARAEHPAPQPDQIGDVIQVYPETRMTLQERRLFQIANLERKLAENYSDPFTYRHYAAAGTLRAYAELRFLRHAVMLDDPTYQPSDITIGTSIQIARSERRLRREARRTRFITTL